VKPGQAKRSQEVMCGIVGLLVLDPALEESLGEMVAPMVSALGTRGPDSTGIALYTEPDPGRCRVSVRRATPEREWDDVAAALSAGSALTNQRGDSDSSAHFGNRADFELRTEGDLGLLSSSGALADTVARLRPLFPAFKVIGYGHAVEVIKDVGDGTEVCRRYRVAERTGYLALGHTRMATESAVTWAHSHPFVPAADLCIVHNGSFSNHVSVRRRLEADGVVFDSDNDSEVAARFLAQRMAQGDDLEQAVRWMTKELDGFFTLGITTADSLVVVRDDFACKPAVIAETDRYVAVASEYRALATLPGIEKAKVFEPGPGEIYLWTR
jgi:methylamine---glutamate N-methyltransferase subunit A